MLWESEPNAGELHLLSGIKYAIEQLHWQPRRRKSLFTQAELEKLEHLQYVGKPASWPGSQSGPCSRSGSRRHNLLAEDFEYCNAGKLDTMHRDLHVAGFSA